VLFPLEVPVRLAASIGGSRWGTHMPGSGGLPLLLGDGYMERQGVGSHTVKSRSNEMPVYDCWGGREGWCVLGMEGGRTHACHDTNA